MGETQFALPDVGEGVAEGELVAWLVEEGERVEEDQSVAEVETDKAIVEIPAAYDGVVSRLHAEEGEVVPVGDVIVTFDVDEESASVDEGSADPGAEDAAVGDEAASAKDATSAEDVAGDDVAGDDAAEAEGADTTDVATGRVFAPPSVRTAAREAGVDPASVSGSGPGGRITAADLRAAIDARARSTDDDGRTQAAPEDAGTADRSRSATTSGGGDSSGTADRDRTLAMPATRRIAREEGVDIDAVPASERRDGEAYVTPDDVRAYAAGETGADADATQSDADTVQSDTDATRPGDRIPYRGVRRTIGERMATAKYTAPHVSHHDEVDVTDLVAIRERLTAATAEDEPRLTYLPFVIKAVVAGLRAQPILNAELDEEAEEIVVHDRYDIGIAVATDAGLMVPVVENADEKGLLELAAEVRDLAARARNRTISPEELQGSTFTITNLGAIGGEHASPIINYPEVGILALGEIKRKPAVHEGEVVPRDLLTVSMSVDHRVVDGADAARFTNEVTRYLNDPDLLLLE
ncbi:2-oxo acid dehydrogenase subunit E2 [Halopenitus persicus]|uniref:Pyruvate dehydrogenase E2 component (Dihydrolipoamide acetyltransferase) n=1 Tax=Halopenitus persicus TaxID=1048396 RepID=A0A1H3FF86_9EURY|nr:2-oxo acid dehydrogenase subunit E2 [Halopenitus persicus]SDX89773.1 pyruvate dehydrogenase E2 component (dihydrolipoamide acetyltransferase) [Halopenitus persicus]